MDNYDQLNEILVYLFDHALDIERNFLIRDTFKDISVNDMHVINAIGLHNEVNMSSLAKKVGVTVGTLTLPSTDWFERNMFFEPAVKQTVVLFSYLSPRRANPPSGIMRISTPVL